MAHPEAPVCGGGAVCGGGVEEVGGGGLLYLPCSGVCSGVFKAYMGCLEVVRVVLEMCMWCIYMYNGCT